AGLVDVDFELPGGPALACKNRLHAKIFLRKHGQIMIRTRHDRSDDNPGYLVAAYLLGLEQLVQPHEIFVAGPASIARDTPARTDFPALHQRKNHIGIADIGDQQHSYSSCCSAISPAWMIFTRPSAMRSRNAPFSSSPSNAPLMRLPSPSWTA